MFEALVKLAVRHGTLYTSADDLPILGDVDAVWEGQLPREVWCRRNGARMLIVRVLSAKRHGNYVVVHGHEMDLGDSDTVLGEMWAVALI